MHEIQIKMKKLNPKARTPVYETAGAAGMDIHALLDSPQRLDPGTRAKIPTGLAFEIPPGFEAQIRPRSGLALNNGLTVLNAPGTIDSDYRGELSIILINLGDKSEVIEDGNRIAQIIFSPVIKTSFAIVEKLSEAERSNEGFGSTGK